MIAYRLLFVLFTLSSQIRAACPNGIDIRYEWNDLPAAFQQKYKAAVQKLHKTTNQWNANAKTHLDNTVTWHNNALFLPVHRWFLIQFHQELKKMDKDVVLPYFDWALHASNFGSSPVFKTFTLNNPGQCVPDLGKNVANPTNHCLARGYSNAHDTTASVAELGELVRNTNDYATFEETLEQHHNVVHLNIGGWGDPQQPFRGDMTFMQSPNDPLFFLHHAFVDKVWNDWQKQNKNRLRSFNGLTSDGSPATASSALPSLGKKVGDVFDTEALCYRYAPVGTKFTGPRVTNKPKGAPLRNSTLTATPELDISSLLRIQKQNGLPPQPAPLPDFYKKMMNISDEKLARIQATIDANRKSAQTKLNSGKPLGSDFNVNGKLINVV